MPLLPEAHARSLLQRDALGQTVFFPAGTDKGSGFLVPDAGTEARILRQLKRIRFIQLAAWTLLGATVIAAVGGMGYFGARAPKWLFVLGPMSGFVTIHLLSLWGRYGAAQGLAVAPGHKPSWVGELPVWAMGLASVILIAAAVGVAAYLERAWPLKAVFWLDDIAHLLAGWKVFGKAAVVVGGATAALFGGAGAFRRWLRPSRDGADSSGQ